MHVYKCFISCGIHHTTEARHKNDVQRFIPVTIYYHPGLSNKSTENGVEESFGHSHL